MTARRRSAHGIFKERQHKPLAPTTSPPFVPGFQPTTTGPSTSQSSSTDTPIFPPGTSSAPTTTSSSTQATSASSSTTQTSTSTSASSSTSTSSTSSSASTSATLRALTTPAQQSTHTQPSYTYSYAGLASSSSSAPSATSSSSSSTIGNMSIGTLVGIIAGGFFGIVFVLILGSYIMRWYRRHSAERDFMDEYNEPAPESTRAAASGRTKDDVFGPQMSQHASSPSFGGSAGLAGQGVMANRAMPARGYGGGYGGYPNVDEEIIGGAYSSQPQPQTAYNQEAYGAYVPYNAASGYQEVMRGYQGQRTFEQPVNYGYAISEGPMPMQSAPANPPPAPAPSISPRPIPTSATPPPRTIHTSATPPPRTTASAALAAAHAAAATVHPPVPALENEQEGQRKSAMYTEDDAYAGF